MNQHKIIFVERVAGTGKSTLAQFIAIQLEKNGFKAKWYNERPFINSGNKFNNDRCFRSPDRIYL